MTQTSFRPEEAPASGNFEEQVRNRYFCWLCDQAKAGEGPQNKGYYILSRILFNKEYYSLLEQDEGRGVDGEELRKLFTQDENELMAIDQGPCNMLEMLLGLATRINYYIEPLDEEWGLWPGFYILLENLGLDKYYDAFIMSEEGGEYYAKIQAILNRALDRTYDFNGEGGYFPVPGTDRDQRKVEIWYQMNEWLMKR